MSVRLFNKIYDTYGKIIYLHGNLPVFCFTIQNQCTDYKGLGTLEFEAVANHAGWSFSHGMNGRLTVGYVVPSGKAGVYLDWGCRNGKLTDAPHTLLLCGGLQFYTGERFSIVTKLGFWMATAMDSNGSRKYYLGSSHSAIKV